MTTDIVFDKVYRKAGVRVNKDASKPLVYFFDIDTSSPSDNSHLIPPGEFEIIGQISKDDPFVKKALLAAKEKGWSDDELI